MRWIGFSARLLRSYCSAQKVTRYSTMAPIIDKVDSLIQSNRIMIFSKSYCPFCNKVKSLFESHNEIFNAIELDLMGAEGESIQEALIAKTNQKTVPNVFVNGHHVGGCDATVIASKEGKLKELLEGGPKEYDYDLAIIGGGSGGIAASKEAAALGKKVVVFDFVKPTPVGTTWGLGGTCVNVGCIPKKLMHKAALFGEDFNDAPYFGWEMPEKVNHNWNKMVEEIQMYLKSLNFGYRTTLREKGITYVNAYATFKEPNKIEAFDKKSKATEVTARNFIVAVGGRPRYPNIPGAIEYGITSDDLFSLPYCPGKTLLVGASYIALECAGFLRGVGLDVTVMVRSIFLRGFDQQMAELIGQQMESHGTKFVRGCVPVSVEKIQDGTPGLLKVTGKLNDGSEYVDEFNTVIFAIGRDACTPSLNLDQFGVKFNPSNGKIIADEREKSTVDHIHAIGDVIDGKLELTPVAIQAGKLLVRRLYTTSEVLTDYVNVPTTVFTPLEYGCVGLSEEDALAKYGPENIEVYHTHFQPLEYTLSKRDEFKSYGKLVCVKNEKNRVVGFHVLGPNAGEITQGYALGIKLGATKADFANLIGIHPTCAENFTTMDISKASGLSVAKKSC
ncbi:thioredoxin reductase 1, cytoplasmic-like [Neocloeon triangulifer]|uniref:thioredoxin reductase 1, cytoplasmic-like n=1 Tax=Neocloeon triangulifer TaxID=2078957 RepID=UPI00286ED057|nr:thioredoxin reductase 1, cytoplasmic-like [Neocloeon triangulifer]XP_059490882.1 thioredoxin reductase 1, cytoplasmic-like [Neocloeon triangulifer]